MDAKLTSIEFRFIQQ